jgi:L-Ala-D/L-Glu epimerase
MSLQLTTEIRTLGKIFPLTISRGTTAVSENLYVFLSDGTHTGIGELSPATAKTWTAQNGQSQLNKFVATSKSLESLESLSPHDVWQDMKDANIDPPAMAALDVALWDLLAKRANLPLYQVLGLPKRAVPTSVTIGINPPEETTYRVPIILETSGAKCLKIKLGSPDGRDHDKAHFLAAKAAAAPFNVKLRVDANGGWTVGESVEMIAWLAGHDVDYVEQPLAEGEEAGLPEVFEKRKLPIFVDESCRFSGDIPNWAHCVDGVNLKLMKCGGITEALRIVSTARAHNLQTMIGCMSESSIAIAGGAAMSALFDYIDLDSHTNLNPDPANGAELVNGVVALHDRPGHGATMKSC